jgi:hypothetical protein
MRKVWILIALLTITAFSNPISLAAGSHDKAKSTIISKELSIINEPITILPDRASGENDTWAQFTTTPFTPDGNITEWETEGIIPEDFYFGKYVYLAYDATNVYVALIWEDDEVNDTLPHWRKSSSEYYDIWEGADDTVTVGFSNSTYTDFWTWTASNKTAENYAYETGGEGMYTHDPDSGNLPHIVNNDFELYNYKPIYDNDMIPIVDHTAIPIGTDIKYFFPDTPNGSQTDVAVGATHNGTAYIIEFVRALDTGHSDDIVLNLTNNDLDFRLAAREKYYSTNMYIWPDTYRVYHQNTPAELTFDPIPESVNNSLLLMGTAYDDYENYKVSIWNDRWVSTWGSSRTIYVSKATGIWSYPLEFNDMNLPLGENNIWITLDAPYEEIISLNQTVIAEDVDAPNIIGCVNISERYPTGVPYDEGYITISTGLQDNYVSLNNISATLYYSVDGGEEFELPMIQFFPDTYLFSANITIDQNADTTINHYYTYYIEVHDTNNNFALSQNYTFFTTIETSTTAPSSITIKSYLGSLIFTGWLILIIRYKKRQDF